MMESGNCSIISWEDADTYLKDTIGSSITNLDKISVNNTLNYRVIAELDGWESKSDLEIFSVINIRQYIFKEAYIITEFSYVKNAGIFKVPHDEIHHFINDYFEKYHECFFNGDVIFILPEVRILILFQHDGFFISYDLPILI